MKYFIISLFLFSLFGCSEFQVCNKNSEYYDQNRCDSIVKANEDREFTRPDRR